VKKRISMKLKPYEATPRSKLPLLIYYYNTNYIKYLFKNHISGDNSKGNMTSEFDLIAISSPGIRKKKVKLVE
jgi:hypothetical protein